MHDHPSNRFIDLWDQNITRFHENRDLFFQTIKSLLKLLSLNVEVLVNHSFGQTYINPVNNIWVMLRAILTTETISISLMIIGAIVYFYFDYLLFFVMPFALTACLMLLYSLLDLLTRKRGIKVDNKAQGTPVLFSILRLEIFLSPWFFYFVQPLVCLIASVALSQVSSIFIPYTLFAGAMFIRNAIIGVGNYYYVDGAIDTDIQSQEMDRRMQKRNYKNTYWQQSKEKAKDEPEDDFASSADE